MSVYYKSFQQIRSTLSIQNNIFTMNKLHYTVFDIQITIVVMHEVVVWSIILYTYGNIDLKDSITSAILRKVNSYYKPLS